MPSVPELDHRAIFPGTDPDGAVSQPAAELLARQLWILLELLVELVHLRLHLLDVRQP